MKAVLGVIAALCVAQVALGATSNNRATDLNLKYTAPTLSNGEGVISQITPQLGLGIASFTGDNMDKVSTRTGLTVGALMDLGRSNFVGETGLLYRQLGASATDIQVNFNYIAVPVYGKYYFADPETSTLYVKAGIIPEFLVSKSASIAGQSVDPNGVNSFDLDIAAGFGGKVAMNDGASLVLETTYARGLTNLSTSGSTSVYNSVFTFTAGVGFSL